MRKSIVSPTAAINSPIANLWRDLERIARVEITSEDKAFPIEHALGKANTTGWRAGATGPQVIKLFFDEPQSIHRIQVQFVDKVSERSQEFSLYAGAPAELHEVVRQQWNFSPNGTTEELEDYAVDLHSITALELRIDPDRSHDPAQSQHFASLQALKIA